MKPLPEREIKEREDNPRVLQHPWFNEDKRSLHGQGWKGVLMMGRFAFLRKSLFYSFMPTSMMFRMACNGTICEWAACKRSENFLLFRPQVRNMAGKVINIKLTEHKVPKRRSAPYIAHGRNFNLCPPLPPFSAFALRKGGKKVSNGREAR